MAQFGLGAWLVEHGVLSREQLDQALEAQVVHGGRLGTNLVELGLLDLDRVGEQLAALSGFPLPPAAWLEAPETAALAALLRRQAERHMALALRLEGELLHVALLDPGTPRRCEELAAATRRRIQPYVLPELRLVRALERHLGIPCAPRFTSLASKLERALPEEARLRGELGIKPLGAGEDLIDESAFAEMHQRLAVARERAQGGPAGAEPAAGALEDELLLDELEEERPSDAAGFEDALAQAADRDGASRAALGLARLHVRAAALFTVHRGMVMGLAAAGEGLEERIDGILIPTDAESAFARVAIAGEPFRGAPPESGVDARVLRALGRGAARELAILPISIRGRVVNLLYVDDGPRPLAATGLAALRALAAGVARAYERLILTQRQSA